MSITFTSQKLLESCTSQLRERRFAREVNGATFSYKLHAQVYSSPVWLHYKGRASIEGEVLLSKISYLAGLGQGKRFATGIEQSQFRDDPYDKSPNEDEMMNISSWD